MRNITEHGNVACVTATENSSINGGSRAIADYYFNQLFDGSGHGGGGFGGGSFRGGRGGGGHRF